MTRRRRLAARAGQVGLVAARAGTLGLFAACAASAAGGCQQEATEVAVRSLERSGRVAFLCLAAPGEPKTLDHPGGHARSLDECSRAKAADPDDYGLDDQGRTTLPHLYALVTQTTRGEIAVIDVTAQERQVLDQDERVPGASFLPVGAQPVDVVAAPGGTAAFVAVAEIGREGIFALPSSRIRPAADRAPPQLSSWPACSLPAAPGDVLVAFDPPKDGKLRASCDEPHGDPPPASSNGDLAAEGGGRQKLLVTLPDLGGIAVIDAQDVLDRGAPDNAEHPPGSYDPCRIERWVRLASEYAPAAPPPLPEPAAGCVNPNQPQPAAQVVRDPRPGGLAKAADRLYVADLQVPVIHVLDVPTPCEPVEIEPLLPASAEDPSRVVLTSRVAVTEAPTQGLERYLYAIDLFEGSTMVFDVSDDAAPRVPLRREHPEWNPFQPWDRIKFASPAQDILVAHHDVPLTDPATGTAPSGVRCDPDPSLTVCTATSTSCDIETLYRTDDAFESGAGPRRLRGTFGFILLSTGAIAVADVDDLDAACRGPKRYAQDLGCPPLGLADPPDTSGGALAASGEASCNVVLPGSPRSGAYFVTNDAAGNHRPGLQTFPLLYDNTGTLLSTAAPGVPVMRAPTPATGGICSCTASEDTGCRSFDVVIGGAPVRIDTNGLACQEGAAQEGPRHTLAMNLEDPRVHIVDQGFSVTYEGPLTGFGSKLAQLRLGVAGVKNGLYDPNSRFCDAGVQSEAALLDKGETPENAKALSDFVEIASDVPGEGDLHWQSAPSSCVSPQCVESCSFQGCTAAFGSADLPRVERELPVVEAYQDRLELGLGALPDDLVKCCFPSLVSFRIRARNQWITLGEATGFLHHVATDPETGACRDRCDPGSRLGARVRQLPPNQLVKDGDPFVFVNPMLRFAITLGACTDDSQCPTGPCSAGVCTPQRDMQFRFATAGAFQALAVSLAQETNDVQPQAITFVRPTGQLAVTDGSLEGLFLVSMEAVDVAAHFF